MFLYFEKKSNKTLMGKKDPFEFSKNRANFTTDFNSFQKS